MKVQHVIEKVRNKQPLIHHITNQVVMNFSANGLLAFGGSPIMAKEPKEVAEIAGASDAVLINIGTAEESEVESMVTAGKAANEKGIPVVLDPVGVPATSFRRASVARLLEEVSFTVIKGNAGEMAYLVDKDWQMKGVESQAQAEDDVEDVAVKVAKKHGVIAVVTGKVDVISDGTNTKKNKSGHDMMELITGSGCLLGSILAACMTVDQSVDSATDVVAFYGKAGETAFEKVMEVGMRSGITGGGTGGFVPFFIDALGISPKDSHFFGGR